MDLPSTVLGQLGNRVQHALRAFSPAEQKTVRAAAETFRPNPKLRVESVITEMQVGEALVSMLQEGGTPSMVERARICPPRSRIGAITPEERSAALQGSPVAGTYDQALDRESAYEVLMGRTTAPAAADPADIPVRGGNPWGTAAGTPTGNSVRPGVGSAPPGQPGSVWGPGAAAPPPYSRTQAAPPRGSAAGQSGSGGGSLWSTILVGDGRRQGVGEALAKSVVRSVGSQVGRAVVRGVLGSLMKK